MTSMETQNMKRPWLKHRISNDLKGNTQCQVTWQRRGTAQPIAFEVSYLQSQNSVDDLVLYLSVVVSW